MIIIFILLSPLFSFIELLSLLKSYTFCAFWILPIYCFFLTSNSTSSALKAVFIIYNKFLFFFAPFINFCWANMCTTAVFTKSAFLIIGFEVRLCIR